MTQHALLLSTPMVVAYLARLKTATRRTPNCMNSLVDGKRVSGKKWKELDFDLKDYHIRDNMFFLMSKKEMKYYKVESIYQPGDRLYFRETWMPYLRGTENNGFARLIKFEGDSREINLPDSLIDWFDKAEEKGFSWRPSIHLPKDVTRLWAECTSCTCERVQDITEEQAKAEGIESYESLPGLVRYKNYERGKDFLKDSMYGFNNGKERQSAEVASFCTLWMSIHGRESWISNPPVYAINYKILSTTGKPLEKEKQP